MADTLERIVDRVYREGISRAEGRAAQIIADAEKHAEQLKNQASAEADRIIAEAKNQAELVRRTAESEMQLSAGRALTQLKSSIVHLLTEQVVTRPLAELISDVQFLRTLVLKLLDSRTSQDLSLTVPAEMHAELVRDFAATMQTRLAGLEIRPGALKQGFIITQKQAGFEIEFTEQTLTEFLQPYLKPAIASLFTTDK